VIENGFVHIPETAPWLGEYLHELSVFPNGSASVVSRARQLHRALPKLRDRVSEPPLDKLMTLQGVYEKWLGTLPPTLGERHGGRASGNGRAQSIGA
jgi:hypothetical protein